MSGVNTPPNPPMPSIREAATALLEACTREFGWSPGSPDGAAVGDDPDCQIKHGHLRALNAALDAPIASRPTILPDVDQALGAIGAMRRGEPIIPEDIHAIVALAEEGARQLDQFGLRFEADKRALDAWKAEHPQMVENAVLPDHADLVVWLVQLLDVVPDGPSVAEVDQIGARLRGALLRAPNALTKDVAVMIERLTVALRLTSRRAFMAEERVRQLTHGLDNARWPDDAPLPVAFEHREIHRSGVVERTTIDRIYAEHPEIKAGHAVRAESGGRRFEGVATQDGRADLEEIECKNTARYDQQELEDRINAKLVEVIAMARPGTLAVDQAVAELITEIAPGWEYAIVPMSTPPQIRLVRYAPGEPL